MTEPLRLPQRSLGARRTLFDGTRFVPSLRIVAMGGAIARPAPRPRRLARRIKQLLGRA
ncbi:MAG TPA: hypothetical protein VIJ42_09235 [Stellaceae bacterium]